MKVSKEQEAAGQDQELGENAPREKPSMKGDYFSVCVLLFLYMLQGIPLGISSAIPILLQNRGVSYAEQASFTFAYYPFTSKLHKDSYGNFPFKLTNKIISLFIDKSHCFKISLFIY